MVRDTEFGGKTFSLKVLHGVEMDVKSFIHLNPGIHSLEKFFFFLSVNFSVSRCVDRDHL